jgi:alpha-galactosidase
MVKSFLYTAIIILLNVNNLFAQKFEELAQTPPMGFNTWNTFQTNINEQMLENMVDNFVSSGMKDAGYRYFVLDDGWMAMQRDNNGNLIADPVKFPGGIKKLVDYVHNKGLKFGIYNCAGTLTCGGYPGTRGYEYQDARLYASWGVDYLKFDWCNTDSLNAHEAYTTMSKAIKIAGRPMVFSLCEWGNHKPWLWAKNIGHLWRTTGDIGAGFGRLVNKGTWNALGVTGILDQQEGLRKYAGPGHWNDLDMLEVGNGMPYNEDKAHFSLWCMLAAPLMAGNDLRKMSAQTKFILTNRDVIAVDQDVLGIEGFKYSAVDGLEIWIKPLANNELAVCFFNRSARPQTITYNWKDHPVKDDLSGINIDFNTSAYKIYDLWLKKTLGNTKRASKTTIGINDVVMVKLTKL